MSTTIDEKIIKELLEKLDKKDCEYVKVFLWQLCYDPDYILEILKLSDTIDVSLLKKEILKGYKKLHEDFHFAEEKSCYDTYDVDLQIEDPIVRDIILEHCLETALDNCLLRNCITNIFKGGIDHNERILEAFNILDFDMEETKFIVNNFDVYKIGELLKAIQEKIYPKKKEETKLSNSTVEVLNSKVIVNNKDLINKFFYLIDSSNEEEVILMLNNFDKFEPVIKALKDLDLDPLKIIKKRDVIESVYDSIERLLSSIE